MKKPDGAIRLCVDYRKLNSITTVEPYYIPSIEEIIAKVGHACVLSKLDLTKGFHQAKVKVADRPKTAFVCPFGKFQYLRMPFGLCNAPSVFQRLMDVVLSSSTDVSAVYIDEVLVMRGSWDEHLVHLDRVFKCLKEAGLTCKPAKCVFGRVKLVFLGHTIGGGKLSVPEDRVRVMSEFPRPSTRKQLKGFLGTINFYRRFIKNFHMHSSILTPSTSKAAPAAVVWTESIVKAFVSLRDSLCLHVSLCIPTTSDGFILETDASGTGIGAVLSVERGSDLLPVAFYSKQLQGPEQRYSAQELEGLGLFKSIHHFAFYLYGRHFSVITDHKPLCSLRSKPQQNRRLLMWALKLTEFDFDIIYRKGTDNTVADCLSRCHDKMTHRQEQEGEDVGVAT